MAASDGQAEQGKAEPLKRFVLELIDSTESKGGLDTSAMDCLNMMDSAEGAGLLQCRSKKNGIGFLFVTEPSGQSVSVSFLYSKAKLDDQSAISDTGDPLVDEPADLRRWGSEILGAQEQMQESGLSNCAVEVSGNTLNLDSKVLFGVQNPDSNSRILISYVGSDQKSPADFDWPSLQDGDILATLLVVNQLAIPCIVIN